MKKTKEIKTEHGYKALLGEGILWNHKQRQLYRIDIEGRKIIIRSPDCDSEQIIPLAQRPGSIACTTRDTLLCAMEDGVYHLKLPAMAGDIIEPPVMELVFPNNRAADTRFNDGKCDPAGRFWVGTTDLAFINPIGTVFRIDGDFTVHEMISPVVISNGISWSPDNTRMYYIDTATKKVAAYHYHHADGTVQFDKFTIAIPNEFGIPDGCTIDAEGMLWVALWGGHSITRWDPENGTLLRRIEVPALNVTSVAFGGTDLETLYITTASYTTPDGPAYPDAGALFSFKPGVPGLPQPFFRLPE